MDNQNEQSHAGTAAPKPFSYEITPRAAHVGGGWLLQLFEGAFEVGGGIHPITEEVTSAEAYEEALADGEAWLISRGVPFSEVATIKTSALPDRALTRLTDDDITTIWQTMPGGPAGWLKSFGFLQFARAIEEEVRGNNISVIAPASADNLPCASKAVLTDEQKIYDVLREMNIGAHHKMIEAASKIAAVLASADNQTVGKFITDMKPCLHNMSGLCKGNSVAADNPSTADAASISDERLGELFEEAISYPMANEDYAGVRLFAALIERELRLAAPVAQSTAGAELEALQQENDKLREALGDSALAATMLHKLSLENGGINAVYSGGAAQILAEALGQQFIESGAENYLEVGFNTNTGVRLLVTLQRCDGKTPANFRAEAEEKLAAATVDLEELRGRVKQLEEMLENRVERKPDSTQEWAKVDGAVAFHLIERHADNWHDAGNMMEAWRVANTLAAPASQAPAQAHWISVEDRMPEIPPDAPGYAAYVNVIAFAVNSVRQMKWAVNTYAKTEKGRTPRWEEKDGRLAFHTPTHWMPLPLPPAPSALGEKGGDDHA